MRSLEFSAYPVADYKTSQPNIIYMVLYRSLTWPSNQAQGGDRKQRENLIKLLDLFESIQDKFKLEVRSQDTGAMSLVEQVRLSPLGCGIVLEEEVLFDLLKSCVSKFITESGASVRDTIAAEHFLDNVPLTNKS